MTNANSSRSEAKAAPARTPRRPWSGAPRAGAGIAGTGLLGLFGVAAANGGLGALSIAHWVVGFFGLCLLVACGRGGAR